MAKDAAAVTEKQFSAEISTVSECEDAYGHLVFFIFTFVIHPLDCA